MNEHELMAKIKAFAVAEAKKAFGFAGVAEGEDMVMINTGGDKLQLIINMEIKE